MKNMLQLNEKKKILSFSRSIIANYTTTHKKNQIFLTWYLRPSIPVKIDVEISKQHAVKNKKKRKMKENTTERFIKKEKIKVSYHKICLLTSFLAQVVIIFNHQSSESEQIIHLQQSPPTAKQMEN